MAGGVFIRAGDAYTEIMNLPDSKDSFYSNVPLFRGFGKLMDSTLYQSLPDGWFVGVADIVQSTKAIAENRYKAVNMAGAAVIASVTNALDNRDFPFAFGGDGASFAVSSRDYELACDALAATATWVKEDLDLEMRVALVPIDRIRAQNLDVRVARYAPSPNVSYAMFSGGGLAWADAAMKRGEFAVAPAASGAHPDLTGLSCRFAEMPSERGLILSVLIVPGKNSDEASFRSLIEEVVALVEKSPGSGRPISAKGPPLRWPTPGSEFEALADSSGKPLWRRRLSVHLFTLMAYVMLRFDISAGGFVPQSYMQQVVENSDFRKFDDGLRMVIDCTPDLADTIERRLAKAAANGFARYGLHRQAASMMTCFTLAASQPDHFHFVDGAGGGYAAAATVLKATLN